MATAAPDGGYTTEATITSADFSVEEITEGWKARLDLTWALPDNPATPAGMIINLPDELVAADQSFNLLDPVGDVMGSCVVASGVADCSFDTDYLEAHPRNISGTFYLWVDVKVNVSETTEMSYTLGGATATIQVNPWTPTMCTTDCDYGGSNGWKYGDYRDGADRISWTITIPVGPDGMEGGEDVVVTEEQFENQSLVRMELQQTSTVTANSEGKYRPSGWSATSTDSYQTDLDAKTLTFTAEEGYYYRAVVTTEITDAKASAKYYNEANVTVGSGEPAEVHNHVTNRGGGGTGLGESVGAFSITKDVTGDGEAAAEAADNTFTGTYTVTTPGGDKHTGEFSVKDGETWTSSTFEKDSTVVLTENTPTTPSTVAWSEGEFSESSFTLTGGQRTSITLTNTATLLTGTFSVAKTVETDDESTIDPAKEFAFDYTCTNAATSESLEGSLTALADGEAVDADVKLPLGSTCEVTEDAEQAAVEGYQLTAPESQSVTISSADTVASLSFLNSYVVDKPAAAPSLQTASESPTTPAAPSQSASTSEPSVDTTTPGLASTGAGVAGWGALGAILLASGLLLARRARR